MSTVSQPNTPGQGADAELERRPGVPMEQDPPRPAGAAHWEEPERQVDPGYILRRAGLPQLTPVFGTSVPPRGISGWIRRLAYRVPEHRTAHWLALLFADRVDVLEDRTRRFAPIALPLALGSGILVWGLSHRRRGVFA